MRNHLCLVLFTLAFLSGCDRSSTTPPRLLINEVMARNESCTGFEEDGLPFQDWVEIYNATDKELRLEGYTLSDNIERPKKYKFPANARIRSWEYKVVTLAGPNHPEYFYDSIDFLRADFALDNERDSIFLFANGRLIDRMTIRNLGADSSLGRHPNRDRLAEIAPSFAPTPGEKNTPPETFRTRFKAGGQPQQSLCNDSDEPVKVRFTILTDPEYPLPDVTMEFIESAGCAGAGCRKEICQARIAEQAEAPVTFIRGDVDWSGEVDQNDLEIIQNHVAAVPLPSPSCSMVPYDVNDDGVVDELDADYLFVFLDGISEAPPLPPFPEAGEDPTPADLPCEKFRGMAEVNLVLPAPPPGGEPGPLLCSPVPGDADPPGQECPLETVDGSYGNRRIRVLTYEALLPAEDEIPAGVEKILWRLTVSNVGHSIEPDESIDLGELNECSCVTYGVGCPSLVINEYQPRNVETLKFICETCVDDQAVRTPDWIEIYNYGDKPLNLSEFGLVGRNAARGGSYDTWTFGRDASDPRETDKAGKPVPDPDYQVIEAGGCRLVLADNDGGDFRRVYRRLIPNPDGSGDLVPDYSIKYYSTRFALNPNRRSGADEFALTRPAFSTNIDKAVLDFSAYAAENPETDLENDDLFLRDLSAARFPDLDFPEAKTLQERFAPEALNPGSVTDCPSPPAGLDDLTACVNRFACDKPPRFIEEVAVRPAGAEAGGRRCPQEGESALVFAYVAIDATTSASRETQGEAAFTVELTYQHENGSPGILSEGSGLLIRPAEGRSADTPPGMMLWEVEAVMPQLPAGLVIFALTVIDRRQGISVVFDEENAPRESPDSSPAVSFSYLVGGYGGASLRLSEVLPDNESIELPGFAGFSFDRSPDYIELHLPQDSEVEFYDLAGHYLAVEPGPGTPIGRARAFALPPGIAPIERGGYLLLALGAVPNGPLPVPTVGLDGFNLEPCSSTLYLVGPDELGNCVVDRISWSCPSDFQGGEITEDLAYGIPCEALGESLRMSPSPGADNGLEPGFFSAFHTEAGSDDPNPCVEPGSFPVLAAIFFLDEALVAVLGGDAIAEAQFDISGAMALGSSSRIFLGDTFAAPFGYTAVRVSQPLLLNGGPGVSRVDYSVSLTDACGNTVSSCDGVARCFSLGIGSAELPAVSVNEANRNFPLPGGDAEARPWLELFNDSGENVDLGGMFLSANPGAPLAVQIPAGTTIAGGGSLVVLTDGGAPLQGPGAPPHVVVELDWVTRRFVCDNANFDGPCDYPGAPNFVRVNCGIDELNPDESAPAVRIFLTDRVDRGSCLLDVFGFEFPNRDCFDGTSLGRFPDGGGEIIVLAEPTPGMGTGPVTFIRGDANADGVVNMTDAHLILGGDPSSCMDRYDVNDDSQVNFINDAIFLMNFLNLGGPPPPPPFPDEGEDPTPDSLPCTR